MRSETGLTHQGADTVESLELKLWGGYARDALTLLQACLVDAGRPVAERGRAAWAMLKWHYAEGDLQTCIALADASRALGAPAHRGMSLATAQCLARLGRHDEAQACVDFSRRRWPELAIEWDMLEGLMARGRAARSAGAAADRAAEDALLAAWNQVLMAGGLEPVRRESAARPLGLDNLVAEAQVGALDGGPLISVVMPVFNAQDTIAAVVRGLLRQTWRPLEVIAVDDGSSDATRARLAEAAAADPRVRVVELPRNMGAYAARNVGMALARGELLTVHDSDDWSHPRKLELQFAAMQAQPDALASVSSWVRVSESLEVVGSWRARGKLVEENLSSLMVRRSALQRLGPWDEVAVGADAEFRHRLICAFGASALVPVAQDKVLSFSLVRQDALTRSGGTHIRTVFHGARWHYADAYRSLAARLGQGAVGQPVDPMNGRRRFPVPWIMRAGGRHRPLDVDLLLVADFAEHGQPLDSALRHLAAARQGGLSTAVMHWRRFSRPARVPLSPLFYTACADVDPVLVCPGDDVRARWVMVFGPALADHLIEPRPSVTAGQWLALCGRTDLDQVDDDALRAVQRHLQGAFGPRGMWLTESATPDQRLRAAGVLAAEASSVPWWTPAAVSALPSRPEPGRTLPRLGRVLLDAQAEWPQSDSDVRLAYGVASPAPCQVLSTQVGLPPPGPLTACATFASEAQPDSIRAFLREKDAYVFQPGDRAHPSRRVELSLALSESLVIVAPPQWRDILGDAAIYAPPDGVMTTVMRLWSEPDQWHAQRERAGIFAARHLSCGGLRQRLEALGEE